MVNMESRYTLEERERIIETSARIAAKHAAEPRPNIGAARLRKLERIIEDEQREREIVRKIHEPEPEPVAQPQPETNPSWIDLINQHIEQRLSEERHLILEQVGEFLHEHFVKRGEEKPKLTAEDVRQLRIDLATTRSEFREMRETIQSTAKGEPRPERSVN
jgi:hypothetical protein